MSSAGDPTGPRQQAPLLNIANVLTVIRLAMVPLLLWLAVPGFEDPARRWWALVVFAAAMGTDVLDGHLARSRDLVTDFGKIVDPIADKAVTGSALIALSIGDYVPWWMTALILVREIGITVMRFTILRYGVLPANRTGKLKTLFQTIAILVCLAPLELLWEPARWLGLALMAVAVYLTVHSGIVTLVQGLRLRSDALRGGA